MQPLNRNRVFLIAGLTLTGVLAGAAWFQTHPPDSDHPDSLLDSSKAALTIETGNELTDERFTPDERGFSKATATLQTNSGTIRIKFFSKDAPKTTRRIAELIRQRFYDGQIFYRVVPGFAIQTGDPSGTGAGGSGKTLASEFNSRRHLEGTLGLARGGDPDSGDSQFYITLSPQPQLDGQYTVFGQVIDGLEFAKKIQRGDRIIRLSIE